MPPGLPHRPPLAMRLWLFRRSAKSGGTGSSDRSFGKAMSIGSLEHMVRNRVRMFLRHTWLVTILGTIVLGGVVWAAIYYSTKATPIRIAAGPPGSSNAKIVQILTDLQLTHTISFHITNSNPVANSDASSIAGRR